MKELFHNKSEGFVRGSVIFEDKFAQRCSQKCIDMVEPFMYTSIHKGSRGKAYMEEKEATFITNERSIEDIDPEIGTVLRTVVEANKKVSKKEEMINAMTFKTTITMKNEWSKNTLATLYVFFSGKLLERNKRIDGEIFGAYIKNETQEILNQLMSERKWKIRLNLLWVLVVFVSFVFAFVRKETYPYSKIAFVTTIVSCGIYFYSMNLKMRGIEEILNEDKLSVEDCERIYKEEPELKKNRKKLRFTSLILFVAGILLSVGISVFVQKSHTNRIEKAAMQIEELTEAGKYQEAEEVYQEFKTQFAGKATDEEQERIYNLQNSVIREAVQSYWVCQDTTSTEPKYYYIYIQGGNKEKYYSSFAVDGLVPLEELSSFPEEHPDYLKEYENLAFQDNNTTFRIYLGGVEFLQIEFRYEFENDTLVVIYEDGTEVAYERVK